MFVMSISYYAEILKELRLVFKVLLAEEQSLNRATCGYAADSSL